MLALFGWRSSPEVVVVVEESEVIRRAPTVDDTFVRRAAGVADSNIRRAAGTTDERIRRP